MAPTTKALYNRYLAELQSGASVSPKLDALELIKQANSDPNSEYNRAPGVLPATYDPEDAEDGGWGSKLIDFISRPIYALGSAAESNVEGGDFGDMISAMGEGLAGRNDITPGTVISNEMGGGFAGGVTGFLADVVFDPLNAIPVAPIVKGVKVVNNAVRGGGKNTKLASELARENAIAVTNERKIIESVPKGVDGTPVVDVTPTVPEIDSDALITEAKLLDKEENTADVLTANTPVEAEARVTKSLDDLINSAPSTAPHRPPTEADYSLPPGVDAIWDGKQYVDRATGSPVGDLRGSYLQEIGQGALPQGLYKDLLVPRDMTTFAGKHTVDPDVAAKISPQLDASAHGSPKEFHTAQTQGELFGELRKGAFKEVPYPAKPPAGASTAWSAGMGRAVGEVLYPRLKVVEDTAENQLGKRLTLAAGKDAPIHDLKLTNVIDALNSADPNVVNRHVYGADRIPPAALGAGAAAAIDSITARIGGKFMGKTAAVDMIFKAMQATKLSRTIAAKNVATALYNSRKALKDAEVANVNKMQARANSQVKAAHKEVQGQLAFAISGKLSPGDQAKVINRIPKLVEEWTKTHGASPAVTIAAAAELAQDVAKAVDRPTTEAFQAAATVGDLRASESATANISPEAIKIQNKAAAVLDEEIEKLAPDASMEELANMSLDIGQSRGIQIRSPRTPLLKSMIELWRAIGPYGFVSLEIREYRKMLETLNKVPQKDLSTLFSSLRDRSVTLEDLSSIPEKYRPAFGNLHAAYNQIVDMSEDSLGMIGGLVRNGANVRQINEAIKMKFASRKNPDGINPKTPQLSENPNKTLAEVLDEIKTWPVEDPVDFLDRMYAAVRSLSANQTIASRLSNTFAKATKEGPDWFKLDAATLNGPIGAHLDPDLYYPKEAIEGIRHLERLVEAPKSFAGSDNIFHQVVDKIYDPLLQIWKTYNTIVRPGHHVRNFIGDGVLNYLAGMRNLPKYYTDAFKILKKDGSAGMVKMVRLRGENIPLSGDKLRELFNAAGLNPSFAVHEDLIKTGGGKVWNALQENSYVKFMGRVSEKSSAEGKMAQFLWELGRQGNIRAAKDLDHLVAIAARNVRKWHPDGSGLFGNEAKIMRRIIPFYSWVRQALPLVAEASLYRPGRILTVPLANYHAALANGAEPSSLSDQFDKDIPYPSFIMNNVLGPYNQAGEAFSFGTPVEAMYGEFLNASPQESVLGSLTPAIKTPIELMYGEKWTGGRITDKSEWVDNAIPVVNNLSSISGVSAAGTIDNLLDGAPALDPQRAVLRGEKDNWLNKNLVNMLAGVGWQDMQKPSYMRIGLNEMRATGG